MGKKKKSAKPGGLKAILAETEAKRAAKANRRRMSSSSGESVESDDPSAIELMERAATKTVRHALVCVAVSDQRLCCGGDV